MKFTDFTKGDLDRALHDLSRTFTGEIASHKTYLDAPIPGLNLLANGIGPIGLPLNEREAQVVKSGCKPAPFGKGERTVVDKSVRDTWEMDASLVCVGWPTLADPFSLSLPRFISTMPPGTISCNAC